MFHFIVPPLFVIEFLHRVVDLIVEYFSDCSETIIKENCVVVYEVCTIKISEL
jgi:AP-3 complex subunit mu